MKKKTYLFLLLFVSVFLIIFETQAKAEQVDSSPESGSTSRFKTIYDSLVSLGHGSDSAGSWGDWGSYWNRIRSSAEWIPDGTVTAADVVTGKTFYDGSRTIQTGTYESSGDSGDSFDYSLQDQLMQTDDQSGDSQAEEASWSLISSGEEWVVGPGVFGTTDVYQDERTSLYWTSGLEDITFDDSLTPDFLGNIEECGFYTETNPGDYNPPHYYGEVISDMDNDYLKCGYDEDTEGEGDILLGGPINFCATLYLDANGDGTDETDWYAPSQKELIQAYLDGIYNEIFEGSGGDSQFWSSTYDILSDEGTEYRPYDVDTANGATKYNITLDDSTYKVVCVRRGDFAEPSPEE